MSTKECHEQQMEDNSITACQLPSVYCLLAMRRIVHT